MKALTSSTKDIAKSIEKSDFLELSDDKTRVRRKTEIKQKADIDDYIIYVECLPSTADHDWIRNTFSVFGNIAYISLPRYKRSKKIKEFAFIEFEQKSSVEKAISAFKEFRGFITTEKSPEELYSIVSYNREEEENSNIASELENTELKKDNIEEKCAENKEEESYSPPPPKRNKLNDVEKTDENIETDLENTENVIVIPGKSGEDNNEGLQDEDGNDIKTKSRRKRIRKRKGDIKKSGTSTSDAPQITDLRITSK